MEDNNSSPSPENSTTTPPVEETEFEKRTGARVEPILEHLEIPGVEINKARIRELFIKMWEFDNVDDLSAEDQHLTTVGLFIYYAHNVLDENNVKPDKAREYIVDALRAWMRPGLDEQVAAEKASDNPFKTFVETGVPRVDEVYTWRNFLLTHKKADENEWTYKMKKCWFFEFMVRFSRADYMKTCCLFDQIAADARKDYVDLKLCNLFAKFGETCQFTYKPVKK